MSSTGALTATVSLAAPILAVGAASTTTGALHLFNAASAIKLVLQSAALAAADRIVTFPDPGGADSVVYAALAQTLTNKTLTSPVISLLIGGTTPTSSLTYKTTTAAGAAGADHIFLVGNNGATEAVRILNNGNFGVGTVAPATKFHVKGSASGADLIILTFDNAGTGANTSASLSFNLGGAAYGNIRSHYSGGGLLGFRSNGATDQWTIASTGGLWAAGATGSDPGAGKINAAGGYQVNGAAITHMLVTNHGGVLIPASTTYYSGFATIGMIATPEARVSNVMTKAGTISSLYITTSTAQPASGSMVCTVRKNGANTAVTLTIAASAAAGTFSDTTNSFTFVAGDLISIGFNNSATVSSAAIYGVSVNVTI